MTNPKKESMMDTKLGKNLLVSISYNLLTMIVPFITAPYLGRVLGAENVGIYTYVHSVAAYFVMFGMLGLRNYGNRTIARNRDDFELRSKAFSELYSLQLITAGTACAGYIVYLIVFCKIHRLMALIVGLYVLMSVFSVGWFLEGMEMFSTMAIRTMFIKLVNLISVFVFVRDKDDVAVYCLIMSALFLASELLLWPSVLKRVKFRRCKWKDIKVHFKPTLLLFVPAIAVSIYQTMDKIMIGAIASETELAYYEYADKIIQIPALVFTAIGSVMLSKMSYVYHNEKEKAEKTIGSSMDLTFLVSTSCMFGVLAIADELVLIYYGIDFVKSGPIMMALVPTIIMYGWANVLRMQYIIPNNLDMVYIKSAFAGAGINLIFNLIFIPKFAALGAAIGTIAAQLTVALFFTFSVRRCLPFKKYIKNNLVLWLIGLGMFIAIKAVQLLHTTSVVYLIVDVLVGVVVYGILYFVYGLFSKNNLAGVLVHGVIKKFKHTK